MAARSILTVLPHRPYIEALAETSEASPEWYSLVAGYAALQLFERWAGCDGSTVAVNALEIRRARRHAAAVPESDPVRRCLLHLVELIERVQKATSAEERRTRGADVGRTMASYAKLLQYDARWALAADVHGTLALFGRNAEDEERLLDSLLMRGYSLRMLGRLDEAGSAYAALRSAAVHAGNQRYRLESYLSEAKLAVDRGNLPAARALLDRTIAEARGAECSVIVSKALTDRARLAAMQEEYELSLSYSREALDLCTEQMDRERILANIAATFALMGLRDAARDVGLLLAATAQDRSARLMATVNLMELAYLDERELVFEQYRRELAREALAPYLEVAYLEIAAQGYRRFGRLAESRQALQRMAATAESHGLHEFVMKADAMQCELVADATAARAVPPARTTRPSGEVERIIRAVAEMRIAAGVPG